MNAQVCVGPESARHERQDRRTTQACAQGKALALPIEGLHYPCSIENLVENVKQHDRHPTLIHTPLDATGDKMRACLIGDE